MLWFMVSTLCFQYSPFRKGEICLWKMVLKLFTTIIVAERQFRPSCTQILPGVIVPVSIEFTGL